MKNFSNLEEPVCEISENKFKYIFNLVIRQSELYDKGDDYYNSLRVTIDCGENSITKNLIFCQYNRIETKKEGFEKLDNLLDSNLGIKKVLISELVIDCKFQKLHKELVKLDEKINNCELKIETT